MAGDPLDDALFEGTFNLGKNEQDRVLREHGHDPRELSDDEKQSLLADLGSQDDADSDQLSDIRPGDTDSGG